MDIEQIFIPEEFSEKKFLDPAEYKYWTLRNNRTFFIDYEIDETYCLMELAKEIILMNAEEKDIKKPDPIKIWIHSYGGDLSQAMFFCDLVQSSRIPIITIATGCAMSAGFLIYLSGKKRYCFPHTQFLVHKGSAEFSGTADQIDMAQKNYKRNIAQMRDYILERTSITAQQFNKRSKDDWYIIEDDIIKYGIADKIITSIEEIKGE